MEIYRRIDHAALQDMLARIRDEIHEWKIININIEPGQPIDSYQISEQINPYFDTWSGSIFICNNNNILILGRFGKTANINAIKDNTQNLIPDCQCQIACDSISKDGLETITLNLAPICAPAAVQKSAEERGATLLKLRQQRSSKVFFIVDDDLFMRSVLSKIIRGYGRVIELADGDTLLEQYKKELPDIIFLDIHLPYGSGLELLKDIRSYDSTAGAIMLSADSTKDNIILARNYGATGFLGKPLKSEKVLEEMNRSIDHTRVLAKQIAT